MRPRAWICLLVFCQAGAIPEDDPTSAASERRPRSPSWMTWGLEYRGRLELPTAINFDPDRDDQFHLNRIRLWAGIGTTPWLRFYAQAQDARAPGFSDASARDSVVHHLDLRQLYADFGRAQGTWGFRLGRQELAFGDERLVGADTYWDALGQSFEAARLTFRSPGLRLDAFGSFAVVPTRERLARPTTANHLYGLYASLDRAHGGSVIEPYLLVKRNRRGIESDLITYGLRAAGGLPARLDYNLEMALQGGYEALESIRAWAAHWEIGIRPFPADFAPRLAAEYNFASGDSHPGDGRHTTFDDLYPAGFNKFGMADPFAWRNTRNVSGSVDWGLGKRWKLGAGYRALWLASIQDGLYTKGDDCLTRNPNASGHHVGDQASLMLAWDISNSWQVHLGYSRFFPGSYLIDSSFRGRYSTPFFMLSYKFE